MDPETITAQVYIDSSVREVHLYQQGIIYATWRISFIRLRALRSKMFFKTTVNLCSVHVELSPAPGSNWRRQSDRRL